MSDPKEHVSDVAQTRLRVLTCPWKHGILWPADLTPLPTDCPAHVATTGDGMVYCKKALTDCGTVLDDRARGALSDE